MSRNTRTRFFFLSITALLLLGCKASDDNVVQVQAPPVKTVEPAMAPVEKPAEPEVVVAPVPNTEGVNFEGFGPAKFGSDAEAVRASWGKPLIAGATAEGSTCVYLNPEPIPGQKPAIGFMFEDDKFVRYDVKAPGQIAPGNIVVGDPLSKIMSVFAGNVQDSPHKYIAGARTITVTPADKSATRLIFEIGKDGKVDNWRVGIPPQIFYVEGCS